MIDEISFVLRKDLLFIPLFLDMHCLMIIGRLRGHLIIAGALARKPWNRLSLYNSEKWP